MAKPPHISSSSLVATVFDLQESLLQFGCFIALRSLCCCAGKARGNGMEEERAKGKLFQSIFYPKTKSSLPSSEKPIGFTPTVTSILPNIKNNHTTHCSHHSGLSLKEEHQCSNAKSMTCIKKSCLK